MLRNWIKIPICLAVFWICLAGLAVTAWGADSVKAPPHKASQYRQELTRQARLLFGLDAPVALFAAQVHQESYWNPNAVSRVGAKGLAQFMPATAKWIPAIDSQLVNPQPTNPKWALRALVRYDHWLYSRLKADTNCDRWAMALSAYNGGLGWVLRDKKAANQGGKSRWLWWDNVELFNAGRSKWAFKENRGYPRRIMQTLMPRYHSWGLGVNCVF